MPLSNSVLNVALNDLSLARKPWYANLKYSSASLLMSVGSFVAVPVLRMLEHPFYNSVSALPMIVYLLSVATKITSQLPSPLRDCLLVRLNALTLHHIRVYLGKIIHEV
jgi:hypothetical protein